MNCAPDNSEFARRQIIPAGNPGYRIEQFALLERFFQYAIHNPIRFPERHFILPVARDQQDFRLDAQINHCAQFPGQLDAVHMRHLPIENNQAEWLSFIIRLAHRVQGILTIVRNNHVESESLEICFDEYQDALVVIDRKNAQAANLLSSD